MAPQRSGRCQKLPHAVRLESRTTPSEDVHRGQVDTEFNPSPSPSGPLASVRVHRPKLKFTEIHVSSPRLKGPRRAPFRLPESVDTLAGLVSGAADDPVGPLQRARAREMKQADRPDAFQLRSARSCACAAVLAMGSLSRPAIGIYVHF